MEPKAKTVKLPGPDHLITITPYKGSGHGHRERRTRR